MRYFLSLVMLIGLVSCASLEPSQSLPDKIAYAYGTHTGIMEATALAVTNHQLSKADGQEVLQLSDQAGTLLESARTLLATDPAAAQDKYTLALVVLTQLQTYLNARSAAHGQ